VDHLLGLLRLRVDQVGLLEDRLLVDSQLRSRLLLRRHLRLQAQLHAGSMRFLLVHTSVHVGQNHGVEMDAVRHAQLLVASSSPTTVLARLSVASTLSHLLLHQRLHPLDLAKSPSRRSLLRTIRIGRLTVQSVQQIRVLRYLMWLPRIRMTLGMSHLRFCRMNLLRRIPTRLCYRWRKILRVRVFTLAWVLS
jgi:hypothetical protein